MKALVLTFDRFALRMLGCYGNEWIATPHFDRLAASSTVFEQHFAENLDLAAHSHAWWTGCYQFPTTPARRGDETGLFGLLEKAGVERHLLIEAGTQVPDPVRTAFGNVTDVDGYDGLDAEDGETPFARLVETAIELFEDLGTDADDSWLVWLKSRGVPRPWIAPREWATRFLDLVDEPGDQPSGPDGDDEPDSAESAAERTDDGRVVDLSPEEFDTLLTAVAGFGESPAAAAEATDTEWRLSRQVYAGYVAHLDDWLGQLLEELDRQFGPGQVLLIVTAAAGESLGEQAAVPGRAADLTEERVHTPFFLRTADRDFSGRRQELIQPVDLLPTLADAFGLAERQASFEGQSLLGLLRGDRPGRDAGWLGDGTGAVAVRTREWFLMRPAEADSPPRLTVKPDDLWDVHDVAPQSPAEAEVLSSALVEFIRRCGAGTPAQPPAVVWETSINAPDGGPSAR